MPADYTSLLIALAVSSFAIVTAVVAAWTSTRKDHYLILSAVGAGLVMVALLLMSLRDGRYVVGTLIVPFTLMHAGTGFFYAGARRFLGKPYVMPALVVGAFSVLVTNASMLMGLLGLTYILHNVTIGAVLLLCAYEYAGARGELRSVTLANAALYALVGASFCIPAVPTILAGNMVAYPPAASVLDTINAIMAIVGMTGIGALTLTLHFARMARQQHTQANTDPLTGVLNRRALFERFAESAVMPGVPVLALDLDHFKLVNDKFGHAHGDRTLQRFTEVLQHSVGERGIVARIGGEEFCAILPGRTKPEAQTIAESICTAFAGLAISRGDGDAVATVSVGLATGGEDEPFASVLSRADAALYRAKRAGRNTVCIEEPHLAA